mmetsp:Transcript_17321/g.52086  ORF Transcript_17321/g.52086 Transcript_17321/m.52086 type:complete len:426 (+) Transcript_17321:918-2195(+)
MVDPCLQHAQQVHQQVRVLRKVKVKGAVQNICSADLDSHILELHMLPSNARVLHHARGRVIVLVVRAVQKRELLPQLLLVGHADEARDVDACGEELQVLHQLLWAVTPVHDAELRENAHVGALQTDAVLQQVDELRKVALGLVVLGHLVQLIRVDNDRQAAQLREPELAAVDARKHDLLPDARAIGLARCVDRLLVPAKLDERAREARIVGQVLEQDACRVVHALVKAAVAARLQVGLVRAIDELLQRLQLVDLCVRVHELCVDARLLLLLAHHEQVLDQVAVHGPALGLLRHRCIIGRVAGAQVRPNRIRHVAGGQLRMCQLAPHTRLIHLGCVVACTAQIIHVYQEHLDGADLLVELLVDLKCLLVQAVLDRLLRDRGTVKVVQAVNQVLDLGGIGLDCRENEQVLQVCIIGESGVLQHNLLE